MVTVLLIRHADIDPPTGAADPVLNTDGQSRARALAHVAGSAAVATILTSEFARTKQTVEPLANRLGLQPREVAQSEQLDALAQQISAGKFGEVILLAGHGNTVPPMIKALGASPAPEIGEREFDNLFIVTVRRPGEANVVHLRYGKNST